MTPATLVVCTHRHGADAVTALDAALHRAPPLEVVLVRSGVAAGTPLPAHLAQWLDRHQEARVEVEPVPGAARARQRGLEAASGEVVLYADDDTVAQPGWAAALLRAAARSDVGAAGGTIVPRFPNGRPPWLAGTLATYYGERVAGATHHRPFGANMALRRDAALAAGGFDAGLGHHGSTPGLHEETYLCDRLAAAGWKVVDAPEAVVEHVVRPDQVSRRWVLRRAWHEGRSDARRAALLGEGDATLRLAKLAGLVASLPWAALHPRAGTHVAARAAVNAGYLWEAAAARRCQ